MFSQACVCLQGGRYPGGRYIEGYCIPGLETYQGCRYTGGRYTYPLVLISSGGHKRCSMHSTGKISCSF